MLIENIINNNQLDANTKISLKSSSYMEKNGNRYSDIMIYKIHINQDFYYDKNESTFLNQIYYSNSNTTFLSKMTKKIYLLSPSDYTFDINETPFKIFIFKIQGGSCTFGKCGTIKQNNDDNYYANVQIILDADCVNLLKFIKFCTKNSLICPPDLFNKTFDKDETDNDYYAKCCGNSFDFCYHGEKKIKNIFLKDIMN